MVLQYQMSIEIHHHHQEIDACALEIAEYVTDHGNWERPILPWGGSCPDLDFEPERFDHQGNNWLCIESNSGKFVFTLWHKAYVLVSKDRHF